MASYLKVKAGLADSARRTLIGNSLFDKKRRVEHSASYVLFPIQSISKATIKKLFGNSNVEILERRAKEEASGRGYRELLEDVLNKKELGELDRGFEALGNIALVRIPDSLKRKEKRIATALMESHKNIKTVLAKGATRGIFRTRRLRFVAGKRNFVAEHKENGCVFAFDTRKAFFSVGLAFERNRINSLIKGRETVLVLFAGVGPFAIEIAKRHPNTKVVAVELNKSAYLAMKENIKRNRVENVTAVHADARELPKMYKSFADRIIMPMPKSSLGFLNEALAYAKKSATMHLYSFGASDSAFSDVAEKIEEHAKKNGYGVRILLSRVVTPYSTKEVEIVIDYKIAKR